MRLSSEKSRWLAALVTVAVMLTVTYLVSGVVFQTNDDNNIVSAACGGITGEPYAGNGFTSYIYGALLSSLYHIAPSIPWHALLLAAVQGLSLVALLRSLFFLCDREKRSQIWALASFVALYIGVGLKFMVYLQFTATPGYCAAAFAALLWTLPDARRARRLICASGLALMTFALLLRMKGGLLALPVPLMAGFVTALKRERASRAALIACAAAVLIAGAGWLADDALYRANEHGWEEQVAYDESSAVLLDYNNEDAAYALAAEVTDWSPQLIKCVRNWSMHIDERFNTKNLTALADAIAASRQAPSLYDLAYRTGSIIKRYPVFGLNALAFAALGLFSFVCAIRRRQWLDMLLLTGLALSTLAVIAYFYGWLNRFPDRVAFVYAMPVYAMVLMLFAGYAPRAKWALPTGAAVLALAAVMTFAAAPGDTLVLPGSSREGRNRLTLSVNSYAAERPDTIFVTDITQSFYAFTPEKAPVNLLDWGNALLKSPMFKRKLEKLGYPDGLGTRNLTDKNVRLLLASDASLQMLMELVNADISPLQAVPEADEGQFKVYRLE